MDAKNSPEPKKGKGCLLWFIGCGALTAIACILLVIVLLIADDDKNTDKQTTPSSQTNTTQNTPVSPTPVEALHLIYPEGPYATNIDVYPDIIEDARCKWQGDTLSREVPMFDDTGRHLVDYIATVHALVPFKQDNRDKILVIMGSVPKNDTGMEPLLGTAVLSRNDNTWVTQNRSDDLSSIGSSGTGVIPTGRLVKIGPNRLGYLIDFGWTGQGITTGLTRIVGQNPDGLFVNFNDLRISMTNEGAGLDANQTYSYDSKLEILADERNLHVADEEDAADDDYYPIRITRTGSCQSIDGNIVSVDHSVVYQKYNEGYGARGEDSQDPLVETCAAD